MQTIWLVVTSTPTTIPSRMRDTYTVEMDVAFTASCPGKGAHINHRELTSTRMATWYLVRFIALSRFRLFP
jgi:hypothetical protein